MSVQVLESEDAIYIAERVPARRVKTIVHTPVNVSVVGLGYVGAVSVACLAELGFDVIGVDISEEKVKAIAAGVSPIVEAGLEERLEDGVLAGRITATSDIRQAILDTDVTLLSVGTPTGADGGVDLSQIRAACRAMGGAIALKDKYHAIILRCSVAPGTTLDVVVPEIEAASGKVLGTDFGVCFVPEFLREGVAIKDFYAPAKTVISASDYRALKLAESIFGRVDRNVLHSSIEAAEMLKYVDNVWHATKVVFANEVGRLCKSIGIDSHEVMELFVKDSKLNLSPYYLKPGFAYGGSCLPKEVRAVVQMAKDRRLDLPLIQSLAPSNANQITEAVRLLEPFKGRKIGILGITFKPGTDDLRESPMLELVATLLEKGESVKIYDPNLRLGPHLRAQIEYLRRANPRLNIFFDNLSKMTLSSANELADSCDVLVVSHATDLFRTAVCKRRKGQHVFDLARLFPTPPAQSEDATYQGIGW